LGKVFILMSIRVEESGFDLGCTLVVAKKLTPDLSSHRGVRNTIKLSGRKTRQKSITSPAICVVLINLLLTNTRSKNLVVGILTDLPNTPIQALEIRRHADLPINIVCTIEVRQLAGTVLHVAFVDHGPIKVA